MKEHLLLCDFDGTISAQDFFYQIMYRYEPEKAFSQYASFRRKEISCFSFLSDVFSHMNLTREQLDDEIQHIPVDPDFVPCIRRLQRHKIDVAVVSAGCKYYIERKLDFLGVGDVKVFANEGVYQNGGLHMKRDESGPFYCEDSGLDKIKVFHWYRPQYQTISYAGNGYVDFAPCCQADVRFARGALSAHLKQKNLPFYELHTFQTISEILLQGK